MLNTTNASKKIDGPGQLNYISDIKKSDQVIFSMISGLTPIISFFLLASSFRSSTLDFKVTNSDF